MTFAPVIPIWAIAALGTALLAILAQGSISLLRKKAPGGWVFFLGCLRLAAVALFMICLLRPMIRYTATARPERDMLALVDVSRSMGRAASTSSGQAASAREDALLDHIMDIAEDSGLIKSLQDSFRLNWYAFDFEARPVNAGELRRLEPVGDATRFAESLESAWNHYQREAADIPPRRPAPPEVLFITDGNDQSTRDVAEMAGKLGMPIHTLAPPRDQEDDQPPTVTVAGAQSPMRVTLGSECRFFVMVTQHGIGGLPVALELLEDGVPVLRQEFAFGADERERLVSLAHRPAGVGTKLYTLQVAPSGKERAFEKSRPYQLTVDVTSRNNRALVIEDTWRWEFKFLRRVFEGDPSFSFTSFLARGSGLYTQFSEPDSAVRLGGFPQSGAELKWFDLIVIGDVKPQNWPNTPAGAINRLVVEDGKSLVVIAGPNMTQLARTPSLESLLPVEITRESAAPIRGPVKVRLTPEGAVSPFFYAPDAAGPAIEWSSLPPMDQVYPPVRKRPAATILLDAPDHSNEFGPIIVMAEHTVGRGRVLFIGSDTLWKWQMLAPADEKGNTPHHIFWQQSLRALAPRHQTHGTVSLALQTDRTKYVCGQTVRVRAELRGAESLRGQQMEAAVSFPDGNKLPLALLPDPADPTVYRGEFEASAPGQYRIATAALSERETVADSTVAVDVERAPDEMARRGTDLAALRRIASATGGRMIDAYDPATWPARDKTDAPAIQYTRTVDMWNSYCLLIATVAVLSLDWLLRMLRGFV